MTTRALAGTREGAASCAACRHARVAHEKRGRGRCSRNVIGYTPLPDGGYVLTQHRCTCLRFTTDGRII